MKIHKVVFYILLYGYVAVGFGYYLAKLIRRCKVDE